MRIALGVTGCIGAYKAVEVLRGLQKHGATVQVVMSRHATEFVTPLTFSSISGLAVITDMWAPSDDPAIKHIEIAQSIDLLLVAPATANAMAKFANGIADDFLSTLYISTNAPVLLAPAMNSEMWLHPATQENVRRLRERGVQFVDPGEGYLACKTVGPGRLAEPEDIVQRSLKIIERGKPAGSESQLASLDLLEEHVLVTAGPTYEALDPVRGITNRSSGRMGYAIAEAALSRGARVTLISGPVSIDPPAAAHLLRVQSALQMYDAVMESLSEATIVVMAAAVSDYRPVQVAGRKIKKDGNALVIELEPTEDILAAVCRKGSSRIVIGFAAETNDLLANATKKLVDKAADLIVGNDVSASDAGFDVSTNRIILVSRESVEELPLLSKRDAADRILDAASRIKVARTPA